jgi:reactive intermediate/imine deaminase
MPRLSAVFALSAAAAVLLLAAPTARRAVSPAGAKPPVGPFSPGIMAGDYLYVSGQGARDASGNLPATVELQTRQCLNNVKGIVEAAGLTMSNVVMANIYLAHIEDFAAMNKVYGEFFKDAPPPARATIAVSRMPTGTPIEISAVAVREMAVRKPVMPPGASPIAPYSPGMLTADRLYVSGALGRDASGKVPTDPAEQVELAMAGVSKVLKTAGLDFSHLVFTNVYITPSISYEAMNAVYRKYFENGNAPARATISVPALAAGVNVEVAGVAVRDLAQRRAVRPRNMPPSPTASPCVFAGDTLYCSAKSAFIPGPQAGIFFDKVEHQVRQSIRNLLDGLEEGALDLSHVVATNVYLDNIDEFAAMNKVYGSYFSAPLPTRTTVQNMPAVERGRDAQDRFPMLEQISLIAVR